MYANHVCATTIHGLSTTIESVIGTVTSLPLQVIRVESILRSLAGDSTIITQTINTFLFDLDMVLILRTENSRLFAYTLTSKII